MDEKYLENLFIQHYLQEADKYVDLYLAARGRGDLRGMREALEALGSRGRAINKRSEKIDEGKKRGESASGELDLYGTGTVRGRKKIPAAVRKEL